MADDKTVNDKTDEVEASVSPAPVLEPSFDEKAAETGNNTGDNDDADTTATTEPVTSDADADAKQAEENETDVSTAATDSQEAVRTNDGSTSVAAPAETNTDTVKSPSEPLTGADTSSEVAAANTNEQTTTQPAPVADDVETAAAETGNKTGTNDDIATTPTTEPQAQVTYTKGEDKAEKQDDSTVTNETGAVVPSEDSKKEFFGRYQAAVDDIEEAQDKVSDLEDELSQALLRVVELKTARGALETEGADRGIPVHEMKSALK